MAAGGIPGVQVLLDDGTGTFPYDISAKTRVGYDLNRGRQDEQSDVTPGAIRSVVLDNTDGRFTLNSTVIATPSPIRPDNRIRIKVAVGNLLTNPSIETNTAGWANTVNCSIARTTAQAFSGAASLQMTATALGDMQSNFAGVPVAAGAAYTFSAYFRTAVTARTCFAYIEWRDAGGAFISGGSSSAVDTSSGWTRASFTMTAPANAVTATVGVGCFAAAAGEVHYADAMMLQQSSALNAYVEGGVLLNRFTGYVQEWPTNWPDGSDLLCEVTLAVFDAQARAERRVLDSIVEEEIQLDNPVGYYTFGEPAGAVVASDSSGLLQPHLAYFVNGGGTYSFGGGTGPGTDGLTAFQAPTGIGNSGAIEGTLAANYTTLSFEIFYAGTDKPPIASGDAYNILNVAGTVVAINENGKVLLFNPNLGPSTATVTDGLVHHIAVVRNGANVFLYIDGNLQTSTADTVTPGSSIFVRAGLGATSVSFGLSLSHLAVFASTLSAARVLAHATAGLTGFAGETDNARLTRIAAYAGIPIGTLDTSLTNVPFKDFSGHSAAEEMRAVADAAVGVTFVNGSGTWDLHNRQRASVKLTPDITLTVDQIDPDTLIPVDMQGVVNYFSATAIGGSGSQQIARNILSEKGDGTVTNPGHGRYSSSKDYLVLSDDDALGRANWIVGNHAEPLPRIPVLKFNLLTLDVATQAALLAAEADTWIRITGLPSQTPGGTTADLLVQGFTERMLPDAWDLSFNVVAMSMFRAWLLGDTTWGVLGSTTRLGV